MDEIKPVALHGQGFNYQTGGFTHLVLRNPGTKEDRIIPKEEVVVALTRPAPAADAVGTAYNLLIQYFDPLDHLAANGCKHGFKPAKKCPKEGCVEAQLHRAMDEAAAYIEASTRKDGE